MTATDNEEQNGDSTKDHFCNFCLAANCKLLICSQCRNSRYCSRPCQKAHWKTGHKLECIPKDGRNNHHVTSTDVSKVPPPYNIMNELWGHVGSLSLDEAHYKMQQTQEEVLRLKAELNKTNNEKLRITKLMQTQKALKQSQSQQLAISDHERHEILGSTSKSRTIIHSDWNCRIEHLTNICCYCVVLSPRKGQNEATSIPTEENLRLSLNIEQPNVSSPFSNRTSFRTQVTLQLLNTCLERQRIEEDDASLSLLSIQLPGKILNDSRVTSFVDCITLRLMYDDGCREDQEFSFQTTPVLLLKELLTCKCCHAKLLVEDSDNPQIKKVLPLPSGYWDEIADYLICYDGDPAVTFTSSSYTTAIKDCVLEDSSVFVMHKEQLGSNVVVLAIEGYGEPSEEPSLNPSPQTNVASSNTNKFVEVSVDKEEREIRRSEIGIETAGVMYRGERSWRDLTGGATLCCSQCCSILGYASISADNSEVDASFRLYKHRLGEVSKHTCGSFISHEMFRYAESQAVFSFNVVKDTSSSALCRSVECLLLKLLSWDTKIATVVNETSGLPCGFEKAVKVFFQEIKISNATKYPTPEMFWNNIDLCCDTLPVARTKKGKKQNSEDYHTTDKQNASVKIFLSVDEWNELLQELVFNSFPVSIAAAAALTKFGTEECIPSTVGLSYLKLL